MHCQTTYHPCTAAAAWFIKATSPREYESGEEQGYCYPHAALRIMHLMAHPLSADSFTVRYVCPREMMP